MICIEIIEVGLINWLVVVVVVDGIVLVNEDGSISWIVCLQVEIDQIEVLVCVVMGFVSNDVCQDDLIVIQIEFVCVDLLLGLEVVGGFSFNKNDLLCGVEVLVMFIIVLLVIFFVVCLLVKGVGIVVVVLVGLVLVVVGVVLVYMLDIFNVLMVLLILDILVVLFISGVLVLVENVFIDIEKIDGQVKVFLIKKVVFFVEQYLEESIFILCSWLYDF